MRRAASDGAQDCILAVLSDCPPRGLTIQELSQKTGLSRATVGKYVLALQVAGQVEVENVGQAKLIRLTGRGSK